MGLSGTVDLNTADPARCRQYRSLCARLPAGAEEAERFCALAAEMLRRQRMGQRYARFLNLTVRQ